MLSKIRDFNYRNKGQIQYKKLIKDGKNLGEDCLSNRANQEA